MWRRLTIGLAVVVSILGVLAYGFTRDPRTIASPLVARPAPAFTLALFDGRQLRLADLRGEVVFLNFWASWCVPCREEAPALEAAWRRYKDQDVVFLGVNIQDKEAEARAFLREFGVSYPNGMDPGSRIAIDYGVYGIPETFFIDRQGRITYKQIGALDAGTLTAKLEEARAGIASAGQGTGDYRAIPVMATARRGGLIDAQHLATVSGWAHRADCCAHNHAGRRGPAP
jgi:cytochrome c biogenesis protein CcmG/thiol:disulfide interchange protein DsbE